MKTYKNDSYTRTVEIIKTSKKCLEFGFTCNVKVTTVWNDILNIRNGETRTTETRWMCKDDILSYERVGYKYYTKNK
tara:strand:+ start:628 stop:858 length:231 start_codon:yes stop_codon:yes gene_type:complete